MIIRYAIRLRNGDYVKQDFVNSLERIQVHGVDNPIDSDLLKDKKTAIRVLGEMLNGNSNLLVLYDEDNPPVEVVEVKIQFELSGINN